MKTFWTHPQKGATLLELFLLFVDTEFKDATYKIGKLKNDYGGETRTGLGIKNDTFVPLEQLDADRAESEVIERHIRENWNEDQEEKKKSAICVRCSKNKKEATNER